jgi:hypothetical protein
MPIKARISKKEFDALTNEYLKGIYKAVDGDADNYALDVEGAEDTSALKRAKDHEAKARKDAEKALKDLQAEHATLVEERDGILKGAIPKGDVDRLEASYKKKHGETETQYKARVAALEAHITKSLVDNVADSLAKEVSIAPKLLAPVIKARLKAEETNGEWVTKVVDADGKPSAFTLDDLKKEILANPEFKTILTGSKGSGGGANRNQGGGGASPDGDGKLDFSKSPKTVAAALSTRLKTPPTMVSEE